MAVRPSAARRRRVEFGLAISIIDIRQFALRARIKSRSTHKHNDLANNSVVVDSLVEDGQQTLHVVQHAKQLAEHVLPRDQLGVGKRMSRT